MKRLISSALALMLLFAVILPVYAAEDASAPAAESRVTGGMQSILSLILEKIKNRPQNPAPKPEETKPAETTSPPPTQPAEPPAETTSPPTSDYWYLAPYEKKVVELVNDVRGKYGLAPVKIDKQLCQIAKLKAEDMYKMSYFDHNSPTYGSPAEMVSSFGVSFKGCGENIAFGYKTPQSVVDGWLSSPSHRKNILTTYYSQMGVGYHSYGNLWAQIFIKP